MSYRFGIIRGDFNDEYSMLGKALGKLQHSFVGVFCPSKDGMTIILFRTFDGTRILSSHDSIEMLSKSELVSHLEISSFNEEEWLIGNRGHSLMNRFLRAVHEILLACESIPDYKHLLKVSIGLEGRRMKNGYYIVNEIVSKALEIKITTDMTEMHVVLLENRFMRPWLNMNNQSKETSYTDYLDFEVKSSLQSLSQNFIELLLEDKFYAEAVYNVKMKQSAAIETVSHDLSKELSALREFIEDMSKGFTSKKKTVVYLDDLVRIYNRLAFKVGDEQIRHFEDGRQSAIIVVKSFDKTPDDSSIDIKLNSGSTIVIPTTEKSFSSFTEDELVQILRYVRSLDVVDGRFHSVSDEIVKELASRINQ